MKTGYSYKGRKVGLLRLYCVLVVSVILTGAILRVRADGLPGEYILSDQWRTFAKSSSPLSNPAFMMENLYTTVSGVASLSIDEAAKLWEAGVVIPMGFYQTAGFTAVGENGRSVQSWSYGNLHNDSLITYAKNDNYLFTLSYAVNPWRRLNVGININAAYQGNFGDSPTYIFGADIGLSYRLLLHPILGFHLFGITFQNPFNIQFSSLEKMPYSSQAKAFYHAEMLGNRIDLDLQYDMKDFMTKAEDFIMEKYVEWDVFVQGGIWPLPFFAIRGFTDIGDSKKFEFWGAACELNVPQINGGRDFSVIYQFRNEVESELQGTHSIYFRADVGRSREEVRSRRIARNISLNASELYNKAMRLYSEGQYWNAYFVYARILTEYPDFYKNDFVGYFAGSCMEELDLRDEAIKLYQTVKVDNPLSSAVPLGDLGMMRIYYRQKAYSSVASQYAELNRPGVPDSIMFHSKYIMGETELRQKEYGKALQYFKLIPETHPVYVFAQYSASTAHALMNSGMHMVSASLEKCISAEVTLPAQKEIVNRALVMLGYIYYEQNALSKVVSALRMVPPESYYYEDALLGLGWTAIKAHQWRDCISSGQMLAQTSKRIIMQGEGELLQAYALLLEKHYEQAQVLLKSTLERIKDYSGFPEDSLNTEKMRNESDRLSYEFLGERVSNIAKRGQSVKQGIMDSLHTVQIAGKQKIDKFLVFEEESKRTMFFERNIQMLKEDLEYTLATVGKIMSTSEYTKTKEKMISKDKAISSEIDKLKEQMDNLDTQ